MCEKGMEKGGCVGFQSTVLWSEGLVDSVTLTVLRWSELKPREEMYPFPDVE